MKDSGYLNPFYEGNSSMIREPRVFAYPHEVRDISVTDFEGTVWKPVDDDLWVNSNGEHYPWDALLMICGPLVEVVE